MKTRKINHSVYLFAFVLLFASISISAQVKDCVCKSASKNDVPLGGNVIEIDSAGTLKQIKGTTRIPVDENGSSDIVVEVFNVTKAEEKNLENDAWKIVEDKKRKAACITKEDGKFCFKNLKDGIYVLRIGTRTRKIEYFNYRYVIVKLNSKNGEDKEIDVTLSLAS